MRWTVLPVLMAVAVVAFVPAAGAQNVAGDYTVSVRGSNYYMDTTPPRRTISDTTTMKITQTGDKVSVEFGTFAGSSAATIFKGKVGNGLICGVWWYEGADHETKVLWGRLQGPTIRGRLMYPRVAYREGLVPGWTEITFLARKKPPTPIRPVVRP